MALQPQISAPKNTQVTSLVVGPYRQAPASDTTHQKLLGTPVHVLATGTFTVTPATVAANTTAEQTFTTVAGLPTNLAQLATTDLVFLNSLNTLPAGLNIANDRVSAAGTIAITFGNHTGAGIAPGALSFGYLVIRP